MPPISQHSFFEIFFLKFKREKGHRGKKKITISGKLKFFYVRNGVHTIYSSWCASCLYWLSWSWNILRFLAVERIWIWYHPWTVNLAVFAINQFRKSATNKDRLSYLHNLDGINPLSASDCNCNLQPTYENQLSSSVNSITSFSSCYQRNKNCPKNNINTRRDRKLKIMLSAKRPSCEVLYSSDFVDGLSQAGFKIEDYSLFYFINWEPSFKKTHISMTSIWMIIELR